MKKETRIEKLERTLYICEYCGKESPSKLEIYDCEKKHKQGKCNHKNRSYHLDVANYDDDTFGGEDCLKIELKCEDCGFEIDSKQLSLKNLSQEEKQKLAEYLLNNY